LAPSPDCQGMQRAPHQRPVGKVDPDLLPHPLHSARCLSGRWSDRPAPQGATLAQGTCLAAVRQEADMPQALEAVGHDMEQKIPDKLMGLQRHGLHAIPLAPIAIREAHAAVAHRQEAMMGHRDAMDIASQIVEHLGWPSAAAQPRPEAGAQRTLEGVGCSGLLGGLPRRVWASYSNGMYRLTSASGLACPTRTSSTLRRSGLKK
jgi:hypothetical protein